MKADILRRTFHHSRFVDKDRLVKLKKKQRLRISLAFPTLNEEATIGKEIFVIKTELVERYPLIDEIAVVDSGSKDRTRQIAARYGARVFQSRHILKEQGSFRGKGENLWKSLYALSGDIIVWIDADISNISPQFVYGLVGPLLEDKDVAYVKAFYRRPVRTATGITSSGGGRVTEILVRPLLSLFYPELAYLVQPLSGEYAGRRSLLEAIPFSVGYGVELGHLIDIYHLAGIGAIAQVDLDQRVHRNQSVEALSLMSYGILRTFLNRLERYGESTLAAKLGEQHIALRLEEGRHVADLTEVVTVERPPMVEVPEYLGKFPR